MRLEITECCNTLIGNCLERLNRFIEGGLVLMLAGGHCRSDSDRESGSEQAENMDPR